MMYQLQSASGEAGLAQAVEANIIALRKLLEALSDITDTCYCFRPAPENSSIGMHTRHIIDHYSCLFAGLDNALIEYDDRSRSVDIETSAGQAIAVLRTKIKELGLINLRQSRRNGTLNIVISSHSDLNAMTVASGLIRELLFLQSHTLHHMAIIQLLLNLQDIRIDPDFAASPSTLKYG